MPKLKLDLNQLNVESFDTATGKPRAGTVFGEQCTCYTNCTCPGCPTCDYTCDYYECGGGTVNDGTCQNYGTCHYNSPCQPIP